MPDKMAAGLLGLDSPIGFSAVYLQNAGFVLQLITFSGHAAPDEADPEQATPDDPLTAP